MKSPITRKITIIILTISLGSVLILGLFINYALNNQFQKYLVNVDQAREDQVIAILAEIYTANNGWPKSLREFPLIQVNALDRLRLVTNNEGQTVLSLRGRPPFNQPRFPNKPLPQDSRPQLYSKARPIMLNGEQIGTAYFTINPIENALIKQNTMFRKTINHSILLAIICTGLISLLVAIIFAKRISSPIREMNQIAKEMTAGNLKSRIKELPQDELGELGISLNALAERLQQVEQLRKKLTADVAHDLRTPLATVRSHLEGILDQVIPASPENINSLLDEVKRLTSLIQNLQEIALADRDSHTFQLEAIDLHTFLKDFIKRQRPLFVQKGVALHFNFNQPVTILADRNALAKIFDNLLSNACKYTPDGKQVSVSLTTNNSTALISVNDQGVGISPKDLPFIFERFYRTDQSRTRDSGGFGLGLTIVKELVEALGGKIIVTSEPGQGTVFTMSFSKLEANREA